MKILTAGIHSVILRIKIWVWRRDWWK